jgi:DNA-binding NarL/FixJ family response regulator
MEPIRVSIVEDIGEIREGLRFLVQQDVRFTCLSAHDSAEEALKVLPKNIPDVVLMDINLPRMNGIACVQELKKHIPDLLIAMFTIYEDSDQIFQALNAGATGYILKSTPPGKLLDALVELHEGGSPMSSSIARKVVQSFQRTVPKDEMLSARENEILRFLSDGLLYKEIGERLGIATGTVKQHIHRIYKKLHVQNRTEAINKASGLR